MKSLRELHVAFSIVLFAIGYESSLRSFVDLSTVSFDRWFVCESLRRRRGWKFKILCWLLLLYVFCHDRDTHPSDGTSAFLERLNLKFVVAHVVSMHSIGVFPVLYGPHVYVWRMEGCPKSISALPPFPQTTYKNAGISPSNQMRIFWMWNQKHHSSNHARPFSTSQYLGATYCTRVSWACRIFLGNSVRCLTAGVAIYVFNRFEAKTKNTVLGWHRVKSLDKNHLSFPIPTNAK